MRKLTHNGITRTTLLLMYATTLLLLTGASQSTAVSAESDHVRLAMRVVICPPGHTGEMFDQVCLVRRARAYKISVEDVAHGYQSIALNVSPENEGMALIELPSSGPTRIRVEIVPDFNVALSGVVCSKDGYRLPPELVWGVSRIPDFEVDVPSRGVVLCTASLYGNDDWRDMDVVSPSTPILAIYALKCPPGYIGTDYASDCGRYDVEDSYLEITMEFAGVIRYFDDVDRSAVWNITGYAPGILTIVVTAPKGQPLAEPIVNCRGFDDNRRWEYQYTAHPESNSFNLDLLLPSSSGGSCILSFLTQQTGV